uniref:DENN domain-containing protein n=1 Tax=Parastrongyloides trichosuri TaxID=131310 RepID=A0A0N4Z648_PARTI
MNHNLLTKNALFNNFCILGQDDFSCMNEVLSSNVRKPPITDIEVIFPKLSEEVPENWEIITLTNGGTSADLHVGSLSTKDCYIIFKRGYHKAPIIDIGVIDKTKNEECSPDSIVVERTRYNNSANLCNNIRGKMYLIYKRAPKDYPPDGMVVTDISVINESKNEKPPACFYKIQKNINKSMIGNDIFICYRKQKLEQKELTFNTKLLDTFPSFLNISCVQNLPIFCVPEGVKIICWKDIKRVPSSFSNTFILTEENGKRVYGTTFCFYEEFDGILSDDQLNRLEIKQKNNKYIDEDGNVITLYKNVAICFTSNFPFFESFHMILQHIRKMVKIDRTFCLERFLSYLLYEIVYPLPPNPHFKLEIEKQIINFNFSNFNDFPVTGASYVETLRLMGPMNLLILVISAIMERNIILHSVRSHMLTIVCESITSLMFPLFWDFPYIPHCPFENFVIFECPCPYIVGIDSKYFEYVSNYHEETVCFGLDTNTISMSIDEIKKLYNSLPMQCIKTLRISLTETYNNLMEEDRRLLAMKDNRDPQIHESFKKHLQNINVIYNRSIKEIFLKFMCDILVGYNYCFIPLKKQINDPKSLNMKNIFNVDKFIDMKQRSGKEFYKRLCKTQAFASLIQERSFKSERSKYYSFFDACLSKSLLNKDEALLEEEGYDTSVIPIYHVKNFEKEIKNNDTFPEKLVQSLFDLDNVEEMLREKDKNGKLEIKNEEENCIIRNDIETQRSNLFVKCLRNENIFNWGKILYFQILSTWFALLPSYIDKTSSKSSLFMISLKYFRRVEYMKLPIIDQLIFRSMMVFCDIMKKPQLCLNILNSMERMKIPPSCQTLQLYHKIMLGNNVNVEKYLKTRRRFRVIVLVVIAFIKKTGTKKKNKFPIVNDKITKNKLKEDNELLMEFISKEQDEVDYSYLFLSKEDDSNIESTQSEVSMQDTQEFSDEGVYTSSEQNMKNSLLGEFSCEESDINEGNLVGNKVDTISISSNFTSTSTDLQSSIKNNFNLDNGDSLFMPLSESPVSSPKFNTSRKVSSQSEYDLNIKDTNDIVKMRQSKSGNFPSSPKRNSMTSSGDWMTTLSNNINATKKLMKLPKLNKFRNSVQGLIEDSIQSSSMFKEIISPTIRKSIKSKYEKTLEEISKDPSYSKDDDEVDIDEGTDNLFKSTFIDGKNNQIKKFKLCIATRCTNERCFNILYDEEILAYLLTENPSKFKCYHCDTLNNPILNVIDCNHDNAVYFYRLLNPIYLLKVIEKLWSFNDLEKIYNHKELFFNILYYFKRCYLLSHLQFLNKEFIELTIVYDIPFIHYKNRLPLYIQTEMEDQTTGDTMDIVKLMNNCLKNNQLNLVMQKYRDSFRCPFSQYDMSTGLTFSMYR